METCDFETNICFGAPRASPSNKNSARKGKWAAQMPAILRISPLIRPETAPASFNAAFQDRSNVVRLGLNYRFGEAITPASFASD